MNKTQARPYADVQNPFSVNEKGAFAEYILNDPESMPHLSLGARVLVQDIRAEQNIWIAATVVDLRAISPFEPERQNLLYREEKSDPTKVLAKIKGPHTHQPMLIRVRLERELTWSEEEKKFYSSAVQRPPSSSSSLVFPDLLPVKDSKEPCLQQLLDIKEKGIPFGAIGFGNVPYQQDKKFLLYNWDIDNLDNKHIFIVGESGSGKTVFLKNLAFQIRSNNPKMRIIMTDVQGDLSQILVPDAVTMPALKGWQAEIEQPKMEDALKTLGPYQLIVPVSRESGAPDNVIALKDLAKKKGVVVSEIGLRLQDLSSPSDVEYLFRVASEQVAMLLDEEAESIRLSGGVVTISMLKESISKMLTQQAGDGAQIKSNGGTSYYKSTAYAAQRALKNLNNYFDHHQLSMGLSTNPLDCLNFDGTTIIFLEHLNYEERLMWEMQLVKWLYDHKRENWEAFVFVDEAHQIVPAYPSVGGSKGTFDRLRSNFDKLSREGRKFGIHLVLSTQSPKDLHEIVPQQCHTKIVMKIDPRNADAAFLDKDLAMIAHRFGHGQFWLMSPFNGTADWVRVHSWMPPLPHGAMTPFWNTVKELAKKR